MSFDFSTLITDRSKADANALSSLLSTPIEEWTDEQRERFYAGEYKGGYSWVDLNRVSDCIEYLSEWLYSLGISAKINTMPIYSMDTKPTTDDFDKYLENIASVRSAIVVPSETPDAPETIDDLTLTAANNIEEILLAVEETITRMQTTFVACGPATCGGDYI